jgi:hypothetical protein
VPGETNLPIMLNAPPIHLAPHPITGKTPLKLQNVSGHDFSRAERVTKSRWALAPAVFVSSYLQFRSG